MISISKMWCSAGLLMTFAVFVKSDFGITPGLIDGEFLETETFGGPLMPPSAFTDIFTPMTDDQDYGTSTLQDNSYQTQYDDNTEHQRRKRSPRVLENNGTAIDSTTIDLAKANKTDSLTMDPTKTNATDSSSGENATVSSEEPANQRTINVDDKGDRERGVLDVLLPKSRVKSAKSFFDGIRRFLSRTFKK